MSEEKVKHSYDESDIQVLEGLEAVRKRPGMYIGTTSIRGLHHLVWEIVDNSIDEALAGYASHIRVILKDDDVVQVIDDGRGMPTGTHAKTGISTVETSLTCRWKIWRWWIQSIWWFAWSWSFSCKCII